MAEVAAPEGFPFAERSPGPVEPLAAPEEAPGAMEDAP